jgi:hypothetical protein
MSVVDDDQRRILITLHELCADGAPVTLMSRDLLVAHHGRFAQLHDDALALEFDRAPEGMAFQPPALCIASFAQGGRTWLFSARLKLHRREVGYTRIALELPSFLRQAENRMAFRVTPFPGSGLHVSIGNAPGALVPVEVMNISLCGILVDASHASVMLGSNDRQVVQLTLGDIQVQLRGLVRRAAHPYYGLYFPEAVVEGRLEPPAPLREIIDRIQQVGATRQE